MKDPRIQKVAKILVDYSVKVKKGDAVMIRGESNALPMIQEVYKLVLLRGGIPKINVILPDQNYIYYKHANESQLKHFPEDEMFSTQKTDAFIYLGGPENTKSLMSIDPKKISLRRKTLKPVTDLRQSKKWVAFLYPTQALAQEAEMSLEEYEDFVFKAADQDWKKEHQKMMKVKTILDQGKKVRIIGEETDISMGIAGRKGEICSGQCNMPDGEVMLAPLEKTVEGKIWYNFPAEYFGTFVEDVRLKFSKGAVVSATASKNEKFLKQMINTDPGAKYIGELGIGCNYGIQRFTNNTLFDEKIGGTIHIALGDSYESCGGTNKSSIHWDMVKDLRKKGEVLVDDNVLISKGKFKL